MKKYVLFLFIAVVVFGCSVFKAKYYDYSGELIILKDNPELYECIDNSPGEVVGKMEGMKAMDKYPYLGYNKNPSIEPTYYKVRYNDKFYYVNYKEAKCNQVYELIKQPTTFSMPKEKDQEAWSRAVRYINKHSDMKIQTQTDLMIETYNPTKDGKKAFAVSKVFLGNEVEYEVRCILKSILTPPIVEAKKLAYYMRTGDEKAISMIK
jgi:hypothetical protein